MSGDGIAKFGELPPVSTGRDAWMRFRSLLRSRPMEWARFEWRAYSNGPARVAGLRKSEPGYEWEWRLEEGSASGSTHYRIWGRYVGGDGLGAGIGADE